MNRRDLFQGIIASFCVKAAPELAWGDTMGEWRSARLCCNGLCTRYHRGILVDPFYAGRMRGDHGEFRERMFSLLEEEVIMTCRDAHNLQRVCTIEPGFGAVTAFNIYYSSKETTL